MSALTVFNLFQPLIEPTRLAPNDMAIFTRVSLIMSAIFIPLSKRLPSTPLAHGAAIVVGAISIASLLFLEFFRANREVDQRALEKFESNLSSGREVYLAALRIVKNDQLLKQLIERGDKDILNKTFALNNHRYNIFDVAASDGCHEAIQMLKEQKVNVSWYTFHRLMNDRLEKHKLLYLLATTKLDDGRYAFSADQKYQIWMALVGNAYMIPMLCGKFGLDPNEQLGPDSEVALDIVIEQAENEPGVALGLACGLIHFGAKVTAAMITNCRDGQLKTLLEQTFDKQKQH